MPAARGRMSTDFTVYFHEPTEPPSLDVLHANVTGYLGGAAVSVSIAGAFIAVRLVGAPSWAYEQPTAMDAKCRGFNVWLHEELGRVSVVTSGQDEYTNTVARGLAAMLKRIHGGHDAPKEDVP